jgi:DHA2 family multidrug resistance protein
MKQTQGFSPWAMLSALLIGTLIGTMGNSMVSIALPSLMENFSISLTTAVWAITLYTLTFSVLIPVFGSLSASIGYKRLFISGMFLVALSSGLCVFAPNFTVFLIARVLIGIGVATILPTIMGIVSDRFPVALQGQATGYWALVNSLGHAIGPILGGVLISYFDWPSIFWINIPLALLSILVAFFVFPSDASFKMPAFDWIGAGAVTVLVFSGMTGISLVSKTGLASGPTLTSFLIAGVALVFIAGYERKHRNPFFDIHLFAKKDYISAIMPISLQAFSQFGLLVSLPVFLIDLQRIDKQLAGLVIMSMTLMMAVTSPIAGRLSDRWGSKRVCFTGTAAIALGAVLMFFLRTDTLSTAAWTIFILSLAIFGTGFGMIQSSSTVAAIQAAPKGKNGVATGFFHMIRFVSASLGSTIVGIMLEMNSQGVVTGYYNSFVLVFLLALVTIPFLFWMAPKASALQSVSISKSSS